MAVCHCLVHRNFLSDKLLAYQQNDITLKDLLAVLQSKSVNILEFKANLKSNRLAQALLAKAKKHEPNITKDLRRIAALSNAEMIGLEDRFKSKESLVRKLHDKSASTKIPIEKIAKRNNDTLRYTFLFSDDNYAQGLASVKKHFEKENYQIAKIFNAWELEGTAADTGYRGLNLTIISSQKQKFELQLHTLESFKLKGETHGLYEEFRNPKTSEARKVEITNFNLKKVLKLKRPKGF